MRYLTPEQVLFIHARLIAETGGEHGIRDQKLGSFVFPIASGEQSFESIVEWLKAYSTST